MVFTLGIKNHGEIIGDKFALNFSKHVDHAENCAGGFSLSITQTLPLCSVVGSKKVVGTVNKDKRMCGHK